MFTGGLIIMLVTYGLRTAVSLWQQHRNHKQALELEKIRSKRGNGNGNGRPSEQLQESKANAEERKQIRSLIKPEWMGFTVSFLGIFIVLTFLGGPMWIPVYEYTLETILGRDMHDLTINYLEHTKSSGLLAKLFGSAPVSTVSVRGMTILPEHVYMASAVIGFYFGRR